MPRRRPTPPPGEVVSWALTQARTCHRAWFVGHDLVQAACGQVFRPRAQFSSMPINHTMCIECYYNSRTTTDAITRTCGATRQSRRPPPC